MLKRSSLAEQIAGLLDQYAESVQIAFMRAIDEIRSAITLKLIIERLTNHDVEGAVRAINLDVPAYAPFLDALAKAYNDHGVYTQQAQPPIRAATDNSLVTLRFNVRDPVAEQWLRQHSSALITEIIDDQTKAIRETIADGVAQFKHPRTIALDIVGRKVGHNRVGGVIGITSQQAEWSRNYKKEIDELDSGALKRNMRDRRFDKTMKTAIQTSKPVSVDTADKMAQAYESNLLRLRGETIARTETATAFGASSDEAMRQNIARGFVTEQMVDQKWNTILDGRERPSHEAMNGQIMPWGKAFVSGDGHLLEYPGDPKAPGYERIGCRCNRTFIIRKEARAK